jgi:hypothetical protein
MAYDLQTSYRRTLAAKGNFENLQTTTVAPEAAPAA